MSVAVKISPEFQVGNPKNLFSAEEANVQLNSFKYTVLPDGKNIVAVKKLGEEAQPNLVLVENWFEEFRDKN